MIKAAEVQIRQGASMQQLDKFLPEPSECHEVDKSLCEVRKSWFLFGKAAPNSGKCISPRPVLQCIPVGSLHTCMKSKSP